MPYKEYFGMKRLPFNRNQPIESLFETEAQGEALARMKYIAETRQFAILTGDPGTGKSTTIRKLAGQLSSKRYTVIYISDAKLSPRNFYTEALNQLGCDPKFYRGDLRRQLHQSINHLMDTNGSYPVIIIDEAHLFDREMYEELRFLLNFEMDSFAPMSLILSGQSELKKLLKLQVYEPIAQRINLRCYILPFNQKQTKDYIYHHTASAGAVSPIFTDSASETIHDYTTGIARKINNVCNITLLQAFKLKHKLIDEALVSSVINVEFAI